MIRTDKIKSSLFGGVGFRQSTLNGYDIVNAANQVSSSGLFFQDENFLITIKNIKETQENVSITDEQFNDLLKQMQESVIINSCNKVTANESEFVQSANLYPHEKTFDTTLDVSDKFNAFRITPNYQSNLISLVSFIELSFDSEKTFNIYLYNSNLPNTPIQTQQVTTIANSSTIQDVKWYISDDVTYKGGVFYLGYFEEDLDGAKPIARNFELSDLQRSTRCYHTEPVKLNHSGTTIDVSNYDSSSDTGGLNIGVEIYNDYTELIIKNKNLFWQAIQTEMAIKVMDLIIHSTVSNSTQRIAGKMADKARIELDGFDDGAMKIPGIRYKNKMIVKDLKKMLFYKPKIHKATLR